MHQTPPLSLFEGSPLEKAKEIVSGSRCETYGKPIDNHSCTAALWSSWLSRKLRTPITLTATDVCWFNILQKCSREANKHDDDNPVDVCGYAQNDWLCRQAAPGQLWPEGTPPLGIFDPQADTPPAPRRDPMDQTIVEHMMNEKIDQELGAFAPSEHEWLDKNGYRASVALCEHPNESPNVCTCDSACYCRAPGRYCGPLLR